MIIGQSMWWYYERLCSYKEAKI